MNNPYENATLVTIPFDSDGEAGSLTYVFGHRCSHEGFAERLQNAAVDWTQSDMAREYAEEQGAVGIDWQDLLAAMSADFLREYGIVSIGHDMGVLELSDDLFFDLPDPEEDEDEAEADG